MIDTHAHIDTEAFAKDRDEVVKRSIESGIESIIVPAIEPSAFRNVLAIAEKYENVYCSMGVHPHNASELTDDVLSIIEENTRHPKVKAIGEIGLDYHYDFNPKDVQQDAFRKQLQLSKKLGLPVIIHNRESDMDMLSILKDEQDGTIKAVMHCFSSDEQMLASIIEMGFNVSFTGNITFKKTDLDAVIRQTPLERLMLETDSPYMTPVPYRGKRNEPMHVRLIAEKIAKIKSINFDEVVSMTTKTARKFFNLTIFTIFFLMGSTLSVFSQSDENTEYEEEYYEDEYYEENAEQEDSYNPYFKNIGIAPVIGMTTVVQSYYFDDERPDEPVSYEGIAAYGVAINYSILDFLIIQGSYLYSKNTKVVEKSEDKVGPSIHQFAELSSLWIINPYSRINFYGAIGVGLINNTYNQGREKESKTSDFGLNTGVGFMFNLPVTDVGLFAFSFEWRLNFVMQRDAIPYLPSNASEDAEITFEEMRPFYSIPRITLVWYPEFLNQEYTFQ